ncbi:MAG: hypothetical protein ACOC1F_08520 [Myxococcota bacterium]
MWCGQATACPGAYPNKTLYHQDVVDTRTCPNACSCSASGAVCRTTVMSYGNANCTNELGGGYVRSNDSWCGLEGAAESIRPGEPQVYQAGSCSGSDPSVQGTVVPAEPITVCCM